MIQKAMSESDPFANVYLSARTAADDLRRHLLAYIRTHRPEPGTRLATETEIVQQLKVSRSTVRRALNPLEKAGWIDRRAGSGTFIGRRVRELELLADESDVRSVPDEQLASRRSRGIVRVAVLIYNIGDLAHDWYTPGVLQGLDDAGHEHRVVVELLGDRDSDVDAISRRLSLSHPDVLICLSNRPKHAFVIRDAQRLGIHCFVSGTPLSGLDVAGVSEDNTEAMRLATQYMIDYGHRKIGLALPRLNEPWVFERLDAYNRTMGTLDISPLVYWTGGDVNDEDVEKFRQFISQQQLTAIIPTGVTPMRMLDALVRSKRLIVPQELSVVSFEQDHIERGYVGHPNATRINFPLREMGRRLGEMSRQAVDGIAFASTRVLMPSTLVEGTTVLQLK